MSWAIWITGPPASGKSSIARAVEAELRARGQPVKRLELDEVRKTITPAPRNSDAERDVVYRALGYMAALLVDAGQPVLIDATAHRRIWRDLVRQAVPRFAEVQLLCPREICRDREQTRKTGPAPREIYRKAGQPGVDIPYEVAPAPELLIDTSEQTLGESVGQVVRLAGRLSVAGAATPAEGSVEPGWAIWITGRPGSGKSTIAMRASRTLRQRGICVRLLELGPVQRFLLGGRPASEEEQDLVHRALAYAAKLLTEAGLSVIVDATASRRAWRQAARDLIPLLCRDPAAVPDRGLSGAGAGGSVGPDVRGVISAGRDSGPRHRAPV